MNVNQMMIAALWTVSENMKLTRCHIGQPGMQIHYLFPVLCLNKPAL